MEQKLRKLNFLEALIQGLKWKFGKMKIKSSQLGCESETPTKIQEKH